MPVAEAMRVAVGGNKASGFKRMEGVYATTDAGKEVLVNKGELIMTLKVVGGELNPDRIYDGPTIYYTLVPNPTTPFTYAVWAGTSVSSRNPINDLVLTITKVGAPRGTSDAGCT
jgi:hypothetical protein